MNIVAAQIVLALGGLFLGTAEFEAMAPLPRIAQTYEVDMPVAGRMVSLYALGVVVGAPLLSVAAARMEKRRLLIGLAVPILVGNAGSALAGGFAWMGAARFVAGLPHGAYCGTAGLVAASLVAPEKRTQAIGHVMLGLAAANVAGAPLVTWMGRIFGWRSAFGLEAAGGAALTALVERLGAEALPVVGDVARREDCERLHAETRVRFGAPRLLVNNAGLMRRAGPWDAPETWREALDVNFTSALRLQSLCVPDMVAAEGPGAEVNLGSKEGSPPRRGRRSVRSPRPRSRC